VEEEGNWKAIVVDQMGVASGGEISEGNGLKKAAEAMIKRVVKQVCNGF